MERARILVRLHADQADKAEITVGAHLGDDTLDAHPRIGLVDGDDVDIDIGPEHLALRAIVDQAIHRRQRIRRHRRAEPADHIAVVVVMRRFYQDHAETPARAGGLRPRLTRLHAGPVPDLRSFSGYGSAKPVCFQPGTCWKAEQNWGILASCDRTTSLT